MTLDTSVAGNVLGRRRRHLRTGSPGRRAADAEPVRGWGPTLLIGLVIATADWLTKAMVIVLLPLTSFTEVLPGSLAFWHVRNDAMVLGLYGDLPLELRKVIALAGAVTGAVLMSQVIACAHRLPLAHRRWSWLFVGLVLGGMLGNLGERAVHWGVTDFISIGWGELWLPPGNLADLALFLSIPMALVVSGLELLARSRRGRAPAAVPVAAETMGD